MKFFNAFLFPFLLILGVYAQSQQSREPESFTECAVRFHDDISKAASSNSDKDADGVLVGKFAPTPGGEGTLTVKRFRIKRTNLYVFASIFYEDDLFFNEMLHDATTLKLSVTSSRSENPKSWLTFSMTQFEYKEDFGAAKLGTIFKYKNRTSGVMMSCEKKSKTK